MAEDPKIVSLKEYIEELMELCKGLTEKDADLRKGLTEQIKEAFAQLRELRKELGKKETENVNLIEQALLEIVQGTNKVKVIEAETESRKVEILGDKLKQWGN
jgi:hypothetical protein